MTTKTASSFIVNPFILNGGVWLLVFLVYQMGWSKLCAPLSTELTLFLILTIAISFAIGILSFRKYGISYSPLKSFSSKAAVLWMIFFYILFAVETVAGGGLPLLGYLSGNITVTYKEFGVPVVHVVLVNGLSCLVLYLYYAYKSFGEKKIRRNLVLLMGIGFIPFVAMFNRGAIISIILGMFIISILASKNTGRTIGKILASFLLIFFLFGLLGNLRSGKQLSKFVMQAGKATKSFYDSPFPDEFFWAYLYMA
ncbi:MAG: hypothetical protein K2G69_07955, partial [Muribaculaceae bacterium]|nr:hypothetical protein [Muribaculaceae bacterium]